MASLKNSKTLAQIEQNLRIPERYKRTWLAIAIITILLLALTAIPLASLMAPSLPETIVANIAANNNFAEAAKILTYVSYGLVAVPYLYLTASWIVGIDNITKSKYFHLFIWVVYSIAAMLIVLAIVFCFRSYII